MKKLTTKKTPKRTDTRSHIPTSTKLQILTESGYMCSNPRCKHILTLELHHIEWIRDGGGNSPENLVALCSNCHDLHTHGHIPRGAIDAWKQMLMLVNGSLDRESLDLLLFLHKYEKKSLDLERRWDEWHQGREEERLKLEAREDTTQRQLRDHEENWAATEPPRSSEHPLRVTGDGLLRLVRLIRTGLVDEGKQNLEMSDWLCVYYWEPSLTPVGRKLADAFLDGNAKTFRELLEAQYELNS